MKRLIVFGVGLLYLLISGIFAVAQDNDPMYVATGEYDCKRDWDAIIRFDNPDTGGDVQESGVIPVKRITDANGVNLNFAHNIHVVEARDEMYVASLFTGLDYQSASELDCTVFAEEGFTNIESGSVGVIANISTATGPQTLVRHIYGDQTGLQQPHSIWIDQEREILYIANTFKHSILVYENAYTVDGNVAPNRVITSPMMHFPAYIYVDEGTDRLFVANFSALNQGPAPLPDDGSRASVLMFDSVSTLEGDVQPTARIVDDGIAPDRTHLTNGEAHVTHNVWYDSETNLAFVVHHTEEVLIYDIGAIEAQCPDPYTCELEPKAVIRIGSDNRPGAYYSVYGIAYDPGLDRLYTSVGFTDYTEYLDRATRSLRPGNYVVEGFPPNGIYVFDGVRDLEGIVSPEPIDIVTWQSGIDSHLDPEIGVEDRYLPPQPVWITMGS